MARNPRANFEGQLEADLYRTCEDIRRAYALEAEGLQSTQTLREWVVLWLRAAGKLSDCVSWSMDDDTIIARKMRQCLPDALLTLVVVLIGWRLWWQRQ